MTMFQEEPVRLPGRAEVERLMREAREYRARALAAFAADVAIAAGVALRRATTAGMALLRVRRPRRRRLFRAAP